MFAKERSQKESIDDFSILDLLAFLMRCWKWVVVNVILFSAVTYYFHQKSPTYSVYGVLLLESGKGSTVHALAEKLSGSNYANYEDKEERLEKYLMILTSRTFMSSVAKHVMNSPEFNTYVELLGLNKSGKEVTQEDVLNTLLWHVSIGRHTSESIRISASSKSPESSVAIANISLGAVKAAMLERETLELQSGKEFLDGQLRDIENRVKAIDDEIMRRDGSLTVELGKTDIPTRFANLGAGVTDMTTRYLDKKIQLDEATSALLELEKQIPNTNSSSIDKYSPQVLAAELRRKVELLQKQHDAYKRMLETVQKKSKGQPGNERKLADLYKQKEMEYQLFNELKRESMSINIQNISTQNKVKLLETARIDGVTTKNLIPDLVKRSILAILLSCICVYFLENYNPVIFGKRDLGSMRIFYLGSVPDLDKRKTTSLRTIFRKLIPRFNRRGEQVGFTHNMEIRPDSYLDMIFKNIRAHIAGFRYRNDEPPKVLSIMSPHMGEGKTSLTNGVSRSFASGSSRVLIIDCDLRRRSLSRSWNFEAEQGLAEYLANPNKEFKRPIVKTVMKNLDILPAGQYSPECTELVSGPHFAETIKAMREYYDVILLDTPPAVPYSEVIPISLISDLVVLSLTVKKTTIESVEKTLERLHFVGQTPVAYVLNKHDVVDSHVYYEDYGPRSMKSKSKSSRGRVA
jgi:capsular exopolysaccharide synthesis family protein